jgi:hypothetical protein
MRQLSTVVFTFLFIILYPIIPGFSASDGPDDILTSVENNTDRWIELEQRIAADWDDWAVDREVLASRLAMMEEQQVSLRANIESYALANRLSDTTWIKLSHELTTLTEAGAAMDERLKQLEDRILALATFLPKRLLDDLAPVLRSMNQASRESEESGELGESEEAEYRSIADRAQSLTAVMTTIAQFSNAINLSHTIRSLPGDTREIDVKVLYWGLSFAYAIDATGDHAWFLMPTQNGWSWDDRSDQAAQFKALINIYEKQMEPELVTVPATMDR